MERRYGMGLVIYLDPKVCVGQQATCYSEGTD